MLAITSPDGSNICLVDCPLQRRPPDPAPAVEGWIETRDGRRLYVRSNYAVQRGPQGEFLGAIANVRDVTEQKIEAETPTQRLAVLKAVSMQPHVTADAVAAAVRAETWKSGTTGSKAGRASPRARSSAGCGRSGRP